MIGAAEKRLYNGIAFTEGWRTSDWKELGLSISQQCLSKPFHTAEGQHNTVQ